MTSNQLYDIIWDAVTPEHTIVYLPWKWRRFMVEPMTVEQHGDELWSMLFGPYRKLRIIRDWEKEREDITYG